MICLYGALLQEMVYLDTGELCFTSSGSMKVSKPGLRVLSKLSDFEVRHQDYQTFDYKYYLRFPKDEMALLILAL